MPGSFSIEAALVELLAKALNVCLWHLADIEFDAEHVRYRG
jgi:hypothetical protein